jgi:hypothetical protein
LKLTVHQVLKDDIFHDMVRVHYSHREGIKAGQICRVSTNGKTVLAVARGTPGNDTNGIWLDDAMRTHLSLKERATAEFEIDKASWYQEFTWMWHSSDPVIRTAGRLGVISFVLGLFGLALGLISLFK